MSMANKCDRCGKLFELTSVPDISITKYIHPYEDEKLDLCEECQEELKKWLEGERLEKYEEKSYCPYFHEEPNYMNAKGVCWATKEREYCPYNGNEEECSRYPR